MKLTADYWWQRRSVVWMIVVGAALTLLSAFRGCTLGALRTEVVTSLPVPLHNEMYVARAAHINAAVKQSGMSLLPRGEDGCFSLCKRKVCRRADTGELYSEGGFVTEEFTADGRRVMQCGNNKRFRVPDYFTIGYSQAGSTFFYKILQNHPEVDKACSKEINFFDKKLFADGHKKWRKKYNSTLGMDDVNQELNGSFSDLGHVDQYLHCFGTAPRSFVGAAHNIIGDNTIKTVYADPALPVWVRALNPSIKLLVLLRNPVDRAFSRYLLKGGGLGCTDHISPKVCTSHFGAYVKQQIDYTHEHCPELATFQTESSGEKIQAPVDPLAVYRCGEVWNNAKIDTDTLISSLYGPHIEHWAHFFPREQFLFLQSERLFREPERVMREVAEFLGIDPNSSAIKQTARTARYNSHKKPAARPIPANVRSKLHTFFQASNKQLDRIAGQALSNDWNNT